MKVKIGSILFAFAFGVLCYAFSSEDRETQKKNLLDSITQRIERLQKKSAPRVSTVAGLRGAKKETSVKPYWKGKKKKRITEQQLAEFKKGIDLAKEGNNEEAISVLENFVKANPKCELTPDAKKVIEMLKEE